MVYMAASQEDRGITEAAALRDIRELQQIGTTPRVAVAVQLHRQGPGPERYTVVKGDTQPLPVLTQVNVGPTPTAAIRNG